MEQEADVTLDHLNHPVDVHHRLLIPSAQVGAHFCVEVLQLKYGCNITLTRQQTNIIAAKVLFFVFYLWFLQAAVEALDIFIKL